MDHRIKLSINEGCGLNAFLIIVSSYFLVSPLIYWTWNDNTIYWTIGSSLILIFEFFIFKNLRHVSFDQDNIFLKPYFSKNTEIIPLENVIRIRRTKARQSTALFYNWLVYKDAQVEKEALFILSTENFPLFYETLKKKGIDLNNDYKFKK